MPLQRSDDFSILFQHSRIVSPWLRKSLDAGKASFKQNSWMTPLEVWFSRNGSPSRNTNFYFGPQTVETLETTLLRGTYREWAPCTPRASWVWWKADGPPNLRSGASGKSSIVYVSSAKMSIITPRNGCRASYHKRGQTPTIPGCRRMPSESSYHSSGDKKLLHRAQTTFLSPPLKTAAADRLLIIPIFQWPAAAVVGRRWFYTWSVG